MTVETHRGRQSTVDVSHALKWPPGLLAAARRDAAVRGVSFERYLVELTDAHIAEQRQIQGRREAVARAGQMA